VVANTDPQPLLFCENQKQDPVRQSETGPPDVQKLHSSKGRVMKKKYTLVFAVLCSGVLIACRLSSIPLPAIQVPAIPGLAQITATPSLTATQNPTVTPSPTSTPLPPTPTIVPPAVLADYLENVRVTKIDTYDDGNQGDIRSGPVSGGTIKLSGEGGDHWGGYQSIVTFQEGKGIVIKFKFSQASVFNMFFDSGTWQTDPYKRFCINLDNGYPSSDLWIGKNGFNPHNLRRNFYPLPDTWYSLLMVVGKDGDFFLLVWDPSNPGKIIQDRQALKKWEGNSWTFTMQANKGVIYFDDFTEIKFDKIK
jgi:hypothetical protein